LLLFPDDDEICWKLGLLMNEVGDLESSKRVLERLIYRLNKNGNNREKAEIVVSNLASIISNEADSILNKVNGFINEGKYDKGLDCCEKGINTGGSSPYFKYYYSKYNYNRYDSINYEKYLAIVSLNELIAKRAFLKYLTGKEKDFEENLSSIYDHWLTPQKGIIFKPNYLGNRNYSKDRRDCLSGCFDALASDMFDKKEWDKAYKFYCLAKEQRLIVSDSLYDEECCRLLYNMAIARYNNEKYNDAINLLIKLKHENGDYKKVEIKSLIKSSKEAYEQKIRVREWNYCFNLGDEASKKFESKDWIGAISKYRSQIECLKGTGIDENSEIIAGINYNKAMALWNYGQYEEALEVLKDIQNKCPSYETILINERINEVIGLL
ncbi:MAG: hypothetical protein J7K40_06915, partial [candidate division Zixibacteria bacterium]|nr:hypothetical protein [candidate division Zixibacteria bacterium]